jgi:hypothetical protein
MVLEILHPEFEHRLACPNQSTALINNAGRDRPMAGIVRRVWNRKDGPQQVTSIILRSHPGIGPLADLSEVLASELTVPQAIIDNR